MKKAGSLLFALTVFCGWVFAQSHYQEKPANGNTVEFIPNKGQIADRSGKVRKDIKYLCQIGDMQVYLRDKGISYVISTLTNPKIKPGYKDDDPPGEEEKDSHQHKFKLRDEPFKSCRVDMDFVDASVPTTQNSLPTEGLLNYYLPQCSNGVTGVQAYQSVRYKNIYPGIDISFKGTFNKGFEYDLIINPGSSPDMIKMKYTGTEKVELKDGKLLFTSYTGNMEEHIPKIYQEINGEKIEVDGKYLLLQEGKDSAEGTIIGFRIGEYNKLYPLIIDPWWASYCGGTSDDEAYACALDNNGNTIASGIASSTDFPISVGAFQTSLVGGMDCFIIKFDATGQRLWATYYGGTGSEGAYGVATDNINNVFITGNTSSSDFPVSGGAFQSTAGGGQDAFVVKFNSNGVRQWGTYCGGSTYDIGTSIATDASGNVAITGYTSSANFPVSPGAFQTLLLGGQSAFLVKFTPNGNRLWGTFLGGSQVDGGFGIGIGPNGNIAITGTASSSNFPVTFGAFQTMPDVGFVSEFNPTGILLWSTYYGGYGNGCAVDKSNNVVIAGVAGDLVATFRVYQTSKTTGQGFAAKFSPKGKQIWATFNNTNQSEAGDYAMTVDDANNVYLEDDEEPPALNNTRCSFEPNYPNQLECLYVVKLDSNAHYSCSTYLSGTVYDEHEYVAGNLSAKNGRLAIAGFTSGGIPTSPGAFQRVALGAYAPYVMNVCSFACGDTIPPSLTVSSITLESDSCSGHVGFTAHASATCDSSGAAFLWSFPGGNPATAVGPHATTLYSNPGTYTAKLVYIACSKDSISKTFTLKSGFHDSLVTVLPGNCHQKGSATAYPGGGGAPYTYLWSNGTTSQTDTGLGAGTYSCVVAAHNGCKDTEVFTIYYPPSPGFITKPISDTGLCAGGSLVLSVSGGSNFTWLPAGSGLSCYNCTSPIASPTVTTIYTIVGTDTVGCPDSARITVKIDSAPQFSFMTTAVSCGGYTIIETGGIPAHDSIFVADSTMPWTWTWSPDSIIINNLGYEVWVSPTVTTTFSATATNGFCSVTYTISISPVTNSFPLSIKAVPDKVCQGKTISLLAVSSSKMISWNWYAPTGLSCTTCVNPDLNTGLLSLSSSTYTVAVQSTDSAGCTLEETIKIYIVPWHINEPGDTICRGAAATLNATSTSTYLWSTGATSSSILVSPQFNTAYYVLVDSAGCHDTDFHPVIIDTGAVLSLLVARDSVCKGSQIPVVVLGNGVTNWLWSPLSEVTCADCNHPLVTVDSVETVVVMATDLLGCISKDSITLYPVSVVPIYENFGICKGNSITLTVPDGTSYQWSNGATTATITVTPLASVTNYSVAVGYNGGCADLVYQTVTTTVANITIGGKTTAIAGVPDTLFASGGGTYLWGTGSTNSFTYVTLTKDTTVTLQVDINGCIVDTVIHIIVLPENPCNDYYIPNVFTPNGDKVNDEFEIKIPNAVKSYSISIYDRWGKEMYSSTDPSIYWKGDTPSGDPVPTGVYYYIISSTCYDGTFKRMGFVQVIR